MFAFEWPEKRWAKKLKDLSNPWHDCKQGNTRSKTTSCVSIACLVCWCCLRSRVKIYTSLEFRFVLFLKILLICCFLSGVCCCANKLNCSRDILRPQKRETRRDVSFELEENVSSARFQSFSCWFSRRRFAVQSAFCHYSFLTKDIVVVDIKSLHLTRSFFVMLDDHPWLCFRS